MTYLVICPTNDQFHMSAMEFLKRDEVARVYSYGLIEMKNGDVYRWVNSTDALLGWHGVHFLNWGSHTPEWATTKRAALLIENAQRK